MLDALTKLGQITGYYDANGHYARVRQPRLQHLLLRHQRDLRPRADPALGEVRGFERCRLRPAARRGATQALAGSNPFLDAGAARARTTVIPPTCRLAHEADPRRNQPSRSSSRRWCSCPPRRPGRRGDGGAYYVRAIFDNGSFIVQDEDVRIGGANVGSVESVDVSMPGEVVTADRAERTRGKAIVVLRHRRSRLPGLPRGRLVPDSPPVADRRAVRRVQPDRAAAAGQRASAAARAGPRRRGGEGEYLLPVENNGKTVDIDLVNNILRRPYAEPLPPHPQQPRRRPWRARGEELERDRPARQPGPARDRRGDRGSSPGKAASSPS